MTTRDRLIRGAAILDTLSYCREVTGDEELGAKIEHYVTGRELADLAMATQIDEIDQRLAERARTV